MISVCIFVCKIHFMKIKYKTKFYLEKRKDKNTGEAKIKNNPIRMSFCFSNKRLEFNTGYRVDASKWDSVQQEVVTNSKNDDGVAASVINSHLTKLKDKIESLYTERFYTKGDVSINGLREELKKQLDENAPNEDKEVQVVDTKTVWERFDEYIDKKSTDKSAGFIKQLKSAKNHLTDYNGNNNITFEDFNVDFFEAFKRYFLKEIGNSKNTFYCVIKRIKFFLNYAVSVKWTTNTDFRDFKADREEYGKPIFLTWDEILKLKNHVFENITLDQVRDCFVFQSMVGCRYEDLRIFSKKNIIEFTGRKKESKKHIILKYIDQKTNQDIDVPLNEIALSIINKYNQLPMDNLLPVISNQNYNFHLKEIGKAAGLNRNIELFAKNKRLKKITEEYKGKHIPIYLLMTTHMARRNFIGNMLNEFLVPGEIIQPMTGHKKGSSAFKRYYEPDISSKIKAIELMNKTKTK